MAAKWPTSVATDADLSVAVNSLQTTLAGAIDNVVTTIPLVSTSGFPTAGYVTIDNEVLSYTGVSGGNLTGATRGADGTSAAAHASAAFVSATIVAAHHNSLKDETKAVEGWLDTVIGKSTTVTAPQFQAGVSTTSKLYVTAQATPGTTVAVAAGVYNKSDGTAAITFAGGNSPAFAVVSANSRIDVLTIDDSGVLAITQGVQAASPVPPAYPATKMALAEVTINQTAGVTVTQANIKDVRPFLNLGGGGTSTFQYVAYTVGTSSGSYSGSTTVFGLPFSYATDGKSLEVYYNGQQLRITNDYTETSTTSVTMTSALVSGAAVWFRTISSAAAVAPTVVTLYREDYVVGTALNNYTGSTTVFNLVNAYNVGGNNLMVTLDGDVQTKGAGIDYLETGSLVVTFTNVLVVGQKVSFLWESSAPSSAVNAGTAGQLAYYPASSGVVSSTPAAAVGAGGNLIAKGTSTNDSAAAGVIGEYIEGVQSTPTNFGADNVWGDLTNIALTAGDWDIALVIGATGSSTSFIQCGISTTAGNSAAGLTSGVNALQVAGPTATNDTALTIPAYRVSLAGSATYYLKYRCHYSSTTPTAFGRLTARRVR